MRRSLGMGSTGLWGFRRVSVGFRQRFGSAGVPTSTARTCKLLGASARSYFCGKVAKRERHLSAVEMILGVVWMWSSSTREDTMNSCKGGGEFKER
eukprot:4733511-Pyramimonas_sp.AAC.1